MHRSTFKSTMFLFLQFLTTSNAYVIGGNPSLQKFSSSFAEPTPPLLVSEFSASWNQHKWDENVSHIASGFLYNSAANKKVRVDEAYNSTLASSLFDFTKVTSDGLVLNDLFTIAPSIASKPVCQQFMANPAFPLVPSDFLTASEAVFAGEAEDEFNGLVQLWNILYQGSLPVTVSVNSLNTIVKYTFFSPVRRTFVVTQFFNIILGPIEPVVFDFPICKG